LNLKTLTDRTTAAPIPQTLPPFTQITALLTRVSIIIIIITTRVLSIT
jgi:hypothetical protein